MGYLSCHVERVGFGMGKHIDRVGVYDTDGKVRTKRVVIKGQTVERSAHSQIKNPQLRKFNQGKGPPASELKAAWKKVVQDLDRKPQKNAAPLLEFNVQASGEWYHELWKKEPKKFHDNCEAFFKSTRDSLQKLHPDMVILKWATHYDEKEPHMHVESVPLVWAKKRKPSKKPKKGKPYDETKVLKFAAGELLGGPDGLTKMHDILFEEVGKVWGLSRGEAGSEAQHTDQAEWQRELSRKDKKLAEQEKNLNDRETVIRDRESAVSIAEEENKALSANLEQQKTEQEEVLRTREATVKARESTADVTDKKNRAIGANLNKQKAEQEKTLNDREASVQDRESAVSITGEKNKVLSAKLEQQKTEQEKTLKDLKVWEDTIKRKEHFLEGMEKAINDRKEKLPGEDQIAVEIIGTLNAEDVLGKERIKFYKIFFAEISDFVKGIIKRIRNVPEQEIRQKTEHEIKKPSGNHI